MLFFQSYSETWLMCLACFGFFVAVAALTWKIRVPGWDPALPSHPIFAASAAAFVLFMGILLTLIDKPHLSATPETLEWLFMFSAFLGIPMAIPLLAWSMWALAHSLRGEPMRLGAFLLIGLGSFALGCAASNMHDLLWCGIITNGYAEHFKAGYDLDLFVAFGSHFGLSREVCADYATLGPYTAVLIAGELLVAVACWLRLNAACRASGRGAH